MPGVGSSPAGAILAGTEHDPTYEANGLRYPRALMFLAQQRGFPMVAGKFLEVHPVDQRVAMKLCFVAGSLSSNPEVGHRLRSVRPGTKSTVAEANDAVRTAVADEIRAGEIAPVSTLIESTSSGVFVEFSYMNLITQKEVASRARLG